MAIDDGYSAGRPGGEDGTAKAQVKQPSAPVFPEELDWKSIGSDLMYRLLAFPREVEIANSTIRASAEYDPPDHEEYFGARQFQYAKLGLMAAEITKEIRKVYKIPEPSTEKDEWYAPTQLKKRIKEIEKERNKYKKKQAQLHRKLLDTLTGEDETII